MLDPLTSKALHAAGAFAVGAIIERLARRGSVGFQFPGEPGPPDYMQFTGGQRPRRYGGGQFWGGHGWPAEAQQVTYANPCPPGSWYSHDAERCLRSVDPFAGNIGGIADPPAPSFTDTPPSSPPASPTASQPSTFDRVIDFLIPRSPIGIAFMYPLVWALPLPVVAAGFVASRFIPRLR